MILKSSILVKDFITVFKNDLFYFGIIWLADLHGKTGMKDRIEKIMNRGYWRIVDENTNTKSTVYFGPISLVFVGHGKFKHKNLFLI